MESWRRELYLNELRHAGIKGQKWGVRRFQYEDGSLTPEGRQRYAEGAYKGYAQARKSAIGESLNSSTATGRSHYDYNPTRVTVKATPVHDESGRVVAVGTQTVRRAGVDPKVHAVGNDRLATSERKKEIVERNVRSDAVGANIGKRIALNENAYRTSSEYRQESAYNSQQNQYPNATTWDNVATTTWDNVATTTWDTVKKKAEETWDTVSSAVSSASKTVVDFASSTFNSAVSAGKSLLDKIFH